METDRSGVELDVGGSWIMTLIVYITMEGRRYIYTYYI
jgi:hypothetical protein